jgi:acyl-CoA synthetase (AMP-forming)/AMP-acid ligase II
MMATGAAPMPNHIMSFLKVAFGCEVMQGYGMTENAAAAFVTPPGYRLTGHHFVAHDNAMLITVVLTYVFAVIFPSSLCFSSFFSRLLPYC